MRILHLVGRSHRRGAEQVAMELADELGRRGHRNELVAVSSGHEGDEVPELPALVHTAVQRPPDLVRAAWRLRPILRSVAPGDRVDVILAHGAAATLVAVGAAPRRPPAIVFQTIVGMAPQALGGPQGAAWRLALRRVDGVVALTGPLGRELQGLGYRGPVWPIPNARQTARFAELDRGTDGAELRRDLGLDPEAHLIGLVGYLVPQKRPERAVEVLARLRADGRDVHLVIAGAGPLEAAVADAATAHGVAEHVSMLGHRDDVPRLLSGLDLLLLTSDDEGVPGVVIEAAMAGCPVVTFPLGGVADVVADGVTGRIVDAPTVTAMAAAVGPLLEDPDLRDQLSTTARERSSQFSMDAVADRYEQHLAEVVAPAR
jgi:glycosyltransferase involved in cell wall biosynthesis